MMKAEDTLFQLPYVVFQILLGFFGIRQGLNNANYGILHKLAEVGPIFPVRSKLL